MIGQPWSAMLLVSVAYLSMFAVGELLRTRLGLQTATTRRFDHVAAGAIALTLPLLFDSVWPVVALAIPFVAFLLVTMVLGWLGSVHVTSRRTVGAFLYPVAVAVTFVAAADTYAWYAIAILLLALADPAGGVIGTRLGRHAYSAWSQHKTWEGSFAVFTTASVVACLGLAVHGEQPLVAATVGLFTGLVVALVEGALPWGLDNVGIPLASLAALGAAGSTLDAAMTLGVSAALLGLALAATRWQGRRRGVVATHAP